MKIRPSGGMYGDVNTTSCEMPTFEDIRVCTSILPCSRPNTTLDMKQELLLLSKTIGRRFTKKGIGGQKNKVGLGVL